jgi:nucleoid-associated protein YgaU
VALGQELMKLEIHVENGEIIKALFNPEQITIQKTANWRPVTRTQSDTNEAQFTHGNAATLSMDLFFDTFEAGEDVREHTQKVFDLTMVEGKEHRPPICELVWGPTGVIFKGVLQSLNQRFVLFLSDGTPVRATLGCTFREWRSRQEEARNQNLQSVDVAKTRIVRRGDTLSSIAAEEYKDPNLWRPIAKVNEIVNPLQLTPGQVLAIPSLRTRSLTGGR